MSTTRLYMKTTTLFLICLYSSLLHAESGKYDASKIVEPTPEMLKMTSAELFKEIDRDGDGQVSFTETNEALEYSPKHTKRKFAKSDRDKSGGLNLKEFEFRLTRTEWWNLSRETPEAMFKAADANQNGTLSKKEFAVFQKKEAHLDVFFNRADLDKSGGVDLEEGTKFINNEIFPSKKLKNIRKAKSKGQGR